MITGTKVQVWHGTADHTPGGLTRADLMCNKCRKVVSKVNHDTAKVLHPNGPPALVETRQGGSIQFLVLILGSLLSGLLTPNNSGSGLSPYRQHLATAASHLDTAMRAGLAPEMVRRAATAVMAHRGRGGSGLLSMLGIKTPLANIPIIGSILG